MKKLVTIGATAMMGFTALGGLQGVTQAVEGHTDPVAGIVNMFENDLLGTTVHADEAFQVKPNAMRIEMNVEGLSNKYGSFLISGSNGRLGVNYDNLKPFLDISILTKDNTLIKGPDNAFARHLEIGDKVQIIFHDGVTGESKPVNGSPELNITDFSSKTPYVFTVQPDGTFVVSEGYLEMEKEVQVSYDHTETPGDPAWYGVVPAAITFTDDNKGTELDASVKIVNADDQQTDYTGSKTVDVKVQSTNGFELKDGAKEAVEYSITKQDGSAVTKDQKEQDLGVLNKGNVKIDSKASLKGEAKESGKFVDTLNYHFIEQ